MVTLWESSKILTPRRLPKKNFKEPTGLNAEKLGAQHVKMIGDAAKNLGTQYIFLGTQATGLLLGERIVTHRSLRLLPSS